MIIKCRNWELRISTIVPDEYMSGWLEYVGVIIPNFGSCISFEVYNKKGRLVIAADYPEYIPKYLEKKIRTEYIKMNKSHK